MLDMGNKNRSAPSNVYRATGRMWLTADRKRVVPEGHRECRFLYCTPGQLIPIAEAKRYGLIKESKPAATKEIRPQETKQHETTQYNRTRRPR